MTPLGPHTDNAPPLALPLTFFVTGLAGLLGALVDLGVHTRNLIGLAYGSGALLSATHLMTLGFISMVMMGAMYQLVPVVMNTTLWSVGLGFWHYGLFVPGVAGLVFGMLVLDPALMAAGGSLVVAGVAVFVFNMVRTLAQATIWGPSGAYVATAIGYLGLTVAMGWLVAWNFVHPFMQGGVFIPVHLALGLLGWFTFTLIGVSYKLLPMFALTPARAPRAWWVYGLLNASIGVAILGSLMGIPDVLGIAGGFGAAAFACYAADVTTLLRARRRRVLDAPVLTALTGLGFLPLTALFAVLADRGVSGWAIVLYLFFFGWMGLSILGYLQKIVPFLLWLHRYAPKIGREPVPRMRDILPETWTWQVYLLYGTGVAAGAVALVAASKTALALALALAGAGVLRLMAAVLQALLREPGILPPSTSRSPFRTSG